MDHKVGDFVTIRRDLKYRDGYHYGVAEPMLLYRGMKARVIKVGDYAYSLCIDRGRFLWDETMFEGWGGW